MFELSIGQIVAYAVMFMLIGAIIAIIMIALVRSASEDDRKRERELYMKNKDRYILSRIKFKFYTDFNYEQFTMKVFSGSIMCIKTFTGTDQLKAMNNFMEWLEEESCNEKVSH